MDSIQKHMKEFWNERARDNAPFYIATWRGYERSDLQDFFITPDDAQEFLTAANYTPSQDAKMLEIGCGIGRMSHGFAKLFAEVHAIDVSGEMIKRANECKGNLSNLHFYETDGKSLRMFGDGLFDFVFSFIVFQHIPDKTIVYHYIREAGRVLKPNGIFHFQINCLADPDTNTPSLLLAFKRIYRNYIRTPFKLMQRALSSGPKGFESPAWVGQRYTRVEILKECHESNLDILNVMGDHTQYAWFTARRRS